MLENISFNLGIYCNPILKKPFPSDRYDYGSARVEKLQNITYPGRGKPKDTCNEFSAFSCKCGKTKTITHRSCGRIVCPVCYQGAINKQSRLSTDRLIYIRNDFKKQFSFNLKFSHFSFNPMWQIRNYADLNKAYEKLYKIFKQEGLSGLIIFHPWRPEKEKILIPWLTNPEKLKEVTKTSLLVEFPHFHVIAIGKPINSDLFLEKYKFTYHRIRSLYSEKAIFSAIRYCLSHTGKFTGKNTIRWFNQLAYNNYNKTVTESVENTICDHCGSCIFKILTPYESMKGNFVKGFYLYFPINYELDYETVLRIKKSYVEYNYKRTFEYFIEKLKIAKRV